MKIPNLNNFNITKLKTEYEEIYNKDNSLLDWIYEFNREYEEIPYTIYKLVYNGLEYPVIPVSNKWRQYFIFGSGTATGATIAGNNKAILVYKGEADEFHPIGHPEIYIYLVNGYNAYIYEEIDIDSIAILPKNYMCIRHTEIIGDEQKNNLNSSFDDFLICPSNSISGFYIKATSESGTNGLKNTFMPFDYTKSVYTEYSTIYPSNKRLSYAEISSNKEGGSAASYYITNGEINPVVKGYTHNISGDSEYVDLWTGQEQPMGFILVIDPEDGRYEELICDGELTTGSLYDPTNQIMIPTVSYYNTTGPISLIDPRSEEEGSVVKYKLNIF